MSIQSVERFELLPSNQPANNTYSFKQGTPLVTFNIGSVSKFLRASSVRINGQIEFFDSANARPNNSGLKTGATSTIEMNPRVGVNSIFQNVNLASNDSNQTLESVRQYGRMFASVVPSVMSEEDFLSHMGVVTKSTAQQTSGDAQMNNKMAFSCRIFSGMMQSGVALALGVNGTRGLQISLELASDQQVLFGAQAAAAGGGYYQVSNLSLSGEMLVPDPATQQKMSVASSGAIVFNTIQNLYSVINASDATQTYNLASDSVLSVFHNFLPITHSNNYSQDGFATDMLKNTDAAGTDYDTDVILKKVSFSRGGMKLGLDYELDSEVQSTQGLPPTGVVVNALNSLQPYPSLTKMVNQPQLYPFGTKDVSVSGSAIQEFGTVDSKKNFAIGLAMDRVSEQGISFKGTSYSLRVQSTADGKSPMSVFTYYLAKNVLQYSPSGIMVSS